MGPQAKWEYMKTIYERYYWVKTRVEKGLLLDEFCKTYKCHRKHALRLLNKPPPCEEKPKRSPRGSSYSQGRIPMIMEAVWKASGYLCGQRLASALPVWLPATRKKFTTTPAEEKLLLAMSSATMDRQLKSKKAYLRKRIYGTTKPGTLLKNHIPIKTNSWDVNKPGYSEIDLVAHCGDCAEGDFANTLDQTDILTAWVSRRCVLGKGQVVVKDALDDMRGELPFDLLGIDSDNGSEFINNHLWRYSQTPPVLQFTRGRPYEKDDNAHIEQKNWTHVRKLLGYGRFDTQVAVDAINDLYRNELCWFQNFFQPSTRLLRKERIGSKLRRKYEKPQTPLERVIASKAGNPVKVAQLTALRNSLDPFALSEIVERKLARIWGLRSKAPKPAWLQKGAVERYWEKPSEGNILKPKLPGVEVYEKVLRRETASQTW